MAERVKGPGTQRGARLPQLAKSQASETRGAIMRPHRREHASAGEADALGRAVARSTFDSSALNSDLCSQRQRRGESATEGHVKQNRNRGPNKRKTDKKEGRMGLGDVGNKGLQIFALTDLSAISSFETTSAVPP
ncbi:hypothetical protein SKAU_G00403090 [Synaphobranchus kaupii]|uniref:Uncharacterized protein n=1 Tax=Synaphobranchus kaupii TaxID=118154 RepID=A0A9Q1E9H5_SYNKA|nr:hypothetical protein SKAU_G00403090 [Synaphobranchus kaupii]